MTVEDRDAIPRIEKQNDSVPREGEVFLDVELPSVKEKDKSSDESECVADSVTNADKGGYKEESSNNESKGNYMVEFSHEESLAGLLQSYSNGLSKFRYVKGVVTRRCIVAGYLT